MASPTADLAILVPVLRRPQNVRPLLGSIKAATPEPYRVVFICDPGDRAEQEAVEHAGGEFFIVAGGYAKKINAAINGTQEPVVFTGADDLEPHAGWLEAANAKRAEVVGVNDLIPRPGRPEHATHFLVTRDYCEQGQVDGEPGLMHEGYAHWDVDDELVATARARGAYAYAEDSIVEHLHPMLGKAEDDEIYRKGRERWKQDRRLFRRRERLWT